MSRRWNTTAPPKPQKSRKPDAMAAASVAFGKLDSAIHQDKPSRELWNGTKFIRLELPESVGNRFSTSRYDWEPSQPETTGRRWNGKQWVSDVPGAIVKLCELSTLDIGGQFASDIREDTAGMRFYTHDGFCVPQDIAGDTIGGVLPSQPAYRRDAAIHRLIGDDNRKPRATMPVSGLLGYRPGVRHESPEARPVSVLPIVSRNWWLDRHLAKMAFYAGSRLAKRVWRCEHSSKGFRFPIVDSLAAQAYRSLEWDFERTSDWIQDRLTYWCNRHRDNSVAIADLQFFLNSCRKRLRVLAMRRDERPRKKTGGGMILSTGDSADTERALLLVSSNGRTESKPQPTADTLAITSEMLERYWVVLAEVCHHDAKQMAAVETAINPPSESRRRGRRQQVSEQCRKQSGLSEATWRRRLARVRRGVRQLAMADSN